MIELFQRIARFQHTTFGDLDRRRGVIQHLHKELAEVEANPDDPEEWIDLIFLAFHGYWMTRRCNLGAFMPRMLSHFFSEDLEEKLEKNLARDWPDLRSNPDVAVEHKR